MYDSMKQKAEGGEAFFFKPKLVSNLKNLALHARFCSIKSTLCIAASMNSQLSLSLTPENLHITFLQSDSCSRSISWHSLHPPVPHLPLLLHRAV